MTNTSRTITLDLHHHTNHSFDCESTIADVLKWADEKLIDVIALTDHDVTTAYLEAEKHNARVRVIPGVEVTTSTNTHVLGYFITEKIRSVKILDVIDEIHDRGGLCSIAHPFRSDTGLIYNQEILGLHSRDEVELVLETVDMIEAVNAKCSEVNRKRTARLVQKYPAKAHSAGSDGHQAYEVGRAVIELQNVSSLSDDDLKSALLNNPRTIRLQKNSAALENASLGADALEHMRGALKRVKTGIPAPAWKRMRSVYLRSREMIGARIERRTMKEFERVENKQ